MRKTKERNSNNGITIIALIITIILMLILATVTVNVVIDGGLFEYAGNAKNVTELASEKETVQKASMLAKNTSKTGRVTVADFEKTINKMVDDASNITVMANSETIALKFNKSNRYYEIDSKGKVTGPIELGTDENAGDLSKGGNYNGESDTTAFLITCIEDLVEFSKNYATYQNSYVKLTKDLDFNSIFSYNDYTSTAYGNLNGDDKTEDIKTELTKQGDNCAGFTPIQIFRGTFDGQGNKICNLYQNREGVTGLFEDNYGTIKNLGLKNINVTGTGYVGGIVSFSYNSSKLQNCSVVGTSIMKKTDSGCMGLIAGRADGLTENCYSKGKVEIDTTGLFGGIAGLVAGGHVKRCYNIMDIESSGGIGGIVGQFQGQTAVIEECYHVGNITGGTSGASGGIVSYGQINPTIKNCYNIGNVNGKNSAGGIGAFISTFDCFNCYSVGEISGTSTYFRGTIIGGNYGRTFGSLFWEKRRYGEFA